MNIAEILKYCPKGTKLYSTIWGDVELSEVTNYGTIEIKAIDQIICNSFTLDYEGRYSHSGECVLFPSKDQRDWEKFRLPVKRGDIMMVDNRAFIISDAYADGISSAFHKYICGIDTTGAFKVSQFDHHWTTGFYIPASEEAKKELFDKMAEAGYKWNADILELEKIEPKFKEGDVIKDNKNNLYLIVDTNSHPKIGCVLNQNMKLTLLNRVTTLASTKFTLANKEERNKLFSTLVKEGYKYDKEQHKLIKQQFKPFDKVLVRDSELDYWRATLFSHIDKKGCYYCVWASWTYCIPYKGNEYLLGTTDSPT